MSISEILLLMNEEDALISSAINKEINKKTRKRTKVGRTRPTGYPRMETN